MGREARRFVHHEQFGVFEHHAEGHRVSGSGSASASNTKRIPGAPASPA